MTASPKDKAAPLIASLTPEALAALSEHRAGMLRYAWDLFARESQKPPPGDWIGNYPVVYQNSVCAGLFTESRSLPSRTPQA